MAMSDSELSEYSELLQALLEGSPEGNDAALNTLLQKLNAFVESEDSEPAENIVQLLGTTVGRQSTPPDWLHADAADQCQRDGKLRIEKRVYLHTRYMDCLLPIMSVL